MCVYKNARAARRPSLLAECGHESNRKAVAAYTIVCSGVGLSAVVPAFENIPNIFLIAFDFKLKFALQNIFRIVRC